MVPWLKRYHLGAGIMGEQAVGRKYPCPPKSAGGNVHRHTKQTFKTEVPLQDVHCRGQCPSPVSAASYQN